MFYPSPKTESTQTIESIEGQAKKYEKQTSCPSLNPAHPDSDKQSRQSRFKPLDSSSNHNKIIIMIQSKHWHYILTAILAAAASAAGAGLYFFSDDYALLYIHFQSWQSQSLWQVFVDCFRVWGNGFWRPLFSFVFTILYGLFGVNAVLYHLVSVFLHISNALLLLTFVRIQKTWTGIWTAALFAVHPLPWEAYGWIASMSDLIAAALVLLSLIFYQQFLNTESLQKLLISLLFSMLAVFTKEAAMFAIPLLVVYHYIHSHTGKPDVIPLKRYAWAHIGNLTLLMIYIAFTLKNTALAKDKLPEYSFSLWSISLAVGKYIAAVVQPYALVDFPIDTTFGKIIADILHPYLTVGLLVCFLILVTCYFFKGRFFTQFTIIWLFLAILPVSSWADYVSSRYAYLGTIPFSILLGCWFEDRLKHWRSLPSKRNHEIVLRYAAYLMLTFFLFTHWYTPSRYPMIKEATVMHDMRTRFFAMTNNKTIDELWWVGARIQKLDYADFHLAMLANKVNIDNFHSVNETEFAHALEAAQVSPNAKLFFEGGEAVFTSIDNLPNKTSMPMSTDSLEVFDHEFSSFPIIGSIDVDQPFNRLLVIKWHTFNQTISDAQLLVSINQKSPVLLSHLSGATQEGTYLWYPGEQDCHIDLINGPQPLTQYQFQLKFRTETGLLKIINSPKIEFLTYTQSEPVSLPSRKKLIPSKEQ